MPRPDHLWYFAYGSNLDPATFVERRRMRPVAIERVVAHGHRLEFDLPIGPGERGVANLVRDPDAYTWGVAYEITVEQAKWLDQTEGVPHGAYQRVELTVANEAGIYLDAFSYGSPRGVPGRKPSPRYMGIILAGAHHHELPTSWIDWLESLELALDERETPDPGAGR